MEQLETNELFGLLDYYDEYLKSLLSTTGGNKLRIKKVIRKY